MKTTKPPAGNMTASQVARIHSDDRQPDLFTDELREAKFELMAPAGNKSVRYEVGKAKVRRRTKAPDAYADEIKKLAKSIHY